MDNSPPHNLILVEVGVVEVKCDLSQVLEGRVHKDHCLRLLVNSRDSLVGHVVVLIFGGIVHMRMVDGLWLMDLSRHKFNVITMAGSATLMSVVLTFTQNRDQVVVKVVVEQFKEVVVVKVVEVVGVVEVHQWLGHLL